MTAQILSGKAIAAELKAGLQPQIDALKAAGVLPKLTVILVGEDPASQVYVRNKHNTFIKMGLDSEVERYPATMTQEELTSRIQALNADPFVHGILVQLPLPAHIQAQAVIDTIDPRKDVDGFHVQNAGALLIGKPRFIPCTPYGIMKMIDCAGVNLRGKQAVVVGASNIVGKPIALLLQAAGATVTICNSKTPDLGFYTRAADVLVVAVGRPKMIGADLVKPGATVIDVGINRIEDGSLCGDVDYDAVLPVAGAITPVPGGVGVMTITMLLVNTLQAATEQAGLSV